MSTYREEVLGKQVDVLEFEDTIYNHDDSPRRCFTRTGTIEKVTLEFVDGKIQSTHYVAFGDDGESKVLNLEQLEMSAKLWWRTSTSTRGNNNNNNNNNNEKASSNNNTNRPRIPHANHASDDLVFPNNIQHIPSTITLGHDNESSSSHNRPTTNKVSSKPSVQISSSSSKQNNERNSIIDMTDHQEDVLPDPTSVTPEDIASVFNDPQRQLGKQVEIEFNIGTDMQFFLGTIQKAILDYNHDGEVQYSYYVVFDDGDTQWFDLEKLERADRLRWPVHVKRVSNRRDTISIKPKQQLGKRVEVKFRVQNTNNHQIFTGTIQQVEMKLVNDDTRIIQYRHRVVFNDGENQWFDLIKLETSGELRWPDAEERTLLKKRGNAEMYDTNDEATKKKPRTSQEETGRDEDIDLFLETIKGNHPSTRVNDYSSSASNMRIQNGYGSISIQHRKASIGSTSPDSSGLEPYAMDDNTRGNVYTPRSMPASIDGVIKYMDLLEPEKTYFERQQDNRKGCSKTRQKLRKFAKSHPTHPAVKHYTQTDKWDPPNGTALLAMMDLIKTMIR